MVAKADYMSKDIVLLSPLFFAYIIFIFLASTNTFEADQARYMMFATNLANGYYSPRDSINLWNGPGYPITLAPFVLLKLPWIMAKLMNAFFLFAAIIYFAQTLRFYIDENLRLMLSFLIGLYPPFLRVAHMLLTETLVLVLVSGFVYHLCRLYRHDTRQILHTTLASFFLGYLALTKIFFGYVILTCAFLFILYYLIKQTTRLKKLLLVYFLAFLICTPWLVYTYSLTGKILYWGSSGGSSLYWMSSPHNEDLGDWHKSKDILENPDKFAKHVDFFQRLSHLDQIQRDEEFRKRAVDQIISNPEKYVLNWIANVGRLLFSYPFSNTPQKITTYFYLVPNMFIVVISILCIYPSYVGRRLIPFEIWTLLVFLLISLGGSSLLSAYERQFRPLIPVVFLWIFVTISKTVKLEIRK
jgi:hypothetical protein